MAKQSFVARLRVIDTLRQDRSALIALGLVVNALYWLTRVGVEWSIQGLFFRLGVDWSRFWGAARAFVAISPAAAYSLHSIAQEMHPIAAYYGTTIGVLGISHKIGLTQLQVGPAPYPPIFLAFFWLFTLPPAPVGFFLWTLLNGLIGLYVVARLTHRFGQGLSWKVFLPLLSFFPFLTGLHDGQLVNLLLGAFFLGYISLEQNQELRAGLWFGALWLKPQYAPVLFLVLIYKRRWSAVIGMIASGLLIALTSLAVGGPGGIVGYLKMLFTDYPSFTGGVAIDPTQMISWRALVVNVLPNATALGLALTAVLSILSVVILVPIWRGSWVPRSPRFAAQMLATMIVTMLVAYHSQIHGLVLCMVPGAILLAARQAPPSMSLLLPWILFAPPILDGLSIALLGDQNLVSLMYLFAMVVIAAALYLHRDDPISTELSPSIGHPASTVSPAE